MKTFVLVALALAAESMAAPALLRRQNTDGACQTSADCALPNVCRADNTCGPDVQTCQTSADCALPNVCRSDNTCGPDVPSQGGQGADWCAPFLTSTMQ